MTQPPDKRPRSSIGKALSLLGILFSILYLLNLTFGIDLLPDALPILGNVDEATATGILLACLRYLGVDILSFVGRGNGSEGPGPGSHE